MGLLFVFCLGAWPLRGCRRGGDSGHGKGRPRRGEPVGARTSPARPLVSSPRGALVVGAEAEAATEAASAVVRPEEPSAFVLRRATRSPSDHELSESESESAPGGAASGSTRWSRVNFFAIEEQRGRRPDAIRESRFEKLVSRNRDLVMASKLTAGAAALGAVLLFRYSRKVHRSTAPTRAVLHLYDHCPFCNRVELVLGWAGIKYERKVYGYGDMDGPKAIHPLQKKELPVLELSGEPTLCVMPESGDIIEWAQSNTALHDYRGDSSGAAMPALMPAATTKGGQALKLFLGSKGEFKKHQRILCRCVVGWVTGGWPVAVILRPPFHLQS